MKVSRFGQKIAATSGIGQLMEDLGSALLQSKDILMLHSVFDISGLNRITH